MNVCQEGVSITKVATKECHDGVSQKGESQRCVSITKVCDYTTLLLAPYRGVIYLTLAPGVRSRWRGRNDPPQAPLPSPTPTPMKTPIGERGSGGG